VRKTGRNGRLPAAVRRTLWSYDVRRIDVRRDQALIITQVLNYGTWDGVKWVMRTYGDEAIREVIRRPWRGMWWPRALNFWMTMLDVRLPRDVIDRAVIRMQPDFGNTIFSRGRQGGAISGPSSVRPSSLVGGGRGRGKIPSAAKAAG